LRGPGTVAVMTTQREDMRCPVCGEGVLADVAYDHPERVEGEAPPKKNDGDSFEVFAFTCGHETRGGTLGTSDYDQIDVEHRNVERIVEPPTGGQGGE
jgi:hypothetical protein